MFNDRRNVIGSFANKIKDDEIVISFLIELIDKGYISSIDKIFRFGGGMWNLPIGEFDIMKL